MQPITKQIHTLLIRNKKTIAVAESCTGGIVASLLTSLSGSSRFFIAGLITYSNRSKERLLHIQHALLARQGAVSQPIAKAMAQQVRKISHADIGIGITGIAGPTGGTPLKPVGTVFVAIALPKNTFCKQFRFKGTRATIRTKAAKQSLIMLAKLLTQYSLLNTPYSA
ncbi:MAG: CinA family protein [Candidatus Omnitrophica bacterium]|nr:CinA family protein [Candidatus Omnitrophota bacterium]